MAGGGRVAKWRESDSILVPMWQTHHSRCQSTCTACEATALTRPSSPQSFYVRWSVIRTVKRIQPWSPSAVIVRAWHVSLFSMTACDLFLRISTSLWNKINKTKLLEERILDNFLLDFFHCWSTVRTHVRLMYIFYWFFFTFIFWNEVVKGRGVAWAGTMLTSWCVFKYMHRTD